VNARDAILAAVRQALEGAPSGRSVVSRGYRTVLGPERIIDLFVERVEDYKAEVRRTRAAEVTTVLASVLAGRSVVVPDGFPHPVAGGTPDTGLSAAELDSIEAVVTTATVGLAETGTVVLDHGPGQGRRALSLVPDLHVCVLRADQVVPDVPRAVALLDPGRPQTWISGPSATSDIELTRVEGVHGPRTLVIVLVE
jgi:L-lactate dehydrogenase complex protein LldG